MLITTICWVGFIAHADAQRKYEDIYLNLPNWSVDQSYSELMEYQVRDPYFANVYIQLAILCEQKLINTDPLREVENTEFWAKNAHLFWGNFKGFYKEDEARHSDYYENLKIPQSGRKLTDQEVMLFADKHASFCKNYSDTAIILYNCLEKAKGAYNSCLSIYRDICDRYPNLNEMLLQYNSDLQKQLSSLSSNYEECISQFNEYKRILALHPLLNYRQIYDTKQIKTFRLDGLTNSDFLQNRFFVWDFNSWINSYNNTLNRDIIPLRKEIESINETYVRGLQEWRRGKPSLVTSRPAYDDLFLFRLGRYDNNSLVRELFSYLESRRQLITMAQDSLALPLDSLPSSRNRHLRHIYRASQQHVDSKRSLDNLASFIADPNTPNRIARFHDFFKNNYGLNALDSFVSDEDKTLSDIFSAILVDYVKYLDNVSEAEPKANTYSTPSGSLPSIPMWIIPADAETTDIHGQYITRCLDRNSIGTPAYVGGDRILAGKQQCFVAAFSDEMNTKWVSPISKATSVIAVRAYESGCVAQISTDKGRFLVYLNDKGKELSRVEVPSYDLNIMLNNPINGTSTLVFNTDSASAISQLDSLHHVVNTIDLPEIKHINAIQEITDGYLIIASNDDGVQPLLLKDGALVNRESNGVDNHNNKFFVDLFRPSAHDFCIISKDDSGVLHYEIINDNLKTLFYL